MRVARVFSTAVSLACAACGGGGATDAGADAHDAGSAFDAVDATSGDAGLDAALDAAREGGSGDATVPTDVVDARDAASRDVATHDGSDATDVAADVALGLPFCTLGTDVAGAGIPAGFCIRRFATVPSARVLAFAPDGSLFVSAPSNMTAGGAPRGPGEILLLTDADRDGVAESHSFVTGVPDVHGIALGNDSLYFTTQYAVWRVPYAPGDLVASAPPALVATFHPGTAFNFRWTHGLAFASDGTLYATQGNYGSAICPPDERDGAISRVLVPHCAAGCDSPWMQCPSAGSGTACVDVQNDPRNCGGCGTVCPAGQACSTGQCGAACPAGYLACNGDCVDPADDSRACGACGTACDPSAHCAGMDTEVSGFRNPMYLRCHPSNAVCLASELSDDGDSFGAPEKIFVVRPGTVGYPCCVDRGVPNDNVNAGGGFYDCSATLRADSTIPLHDTPFGSDWERGSWPAPYRGAVFIALHGSAYGATLWEGTRVQFAAADPVTLAPTGAWSDFLTGFGPGGSALERAADVAFAPDGRMFLADDQGGAVYWIAPADLRAPQ